MNKYLLQSILIFILVFIVFLSLFLISCMEKILTYNAIDNNKVDFLTDNTITKNPSFTLEDFKIIHIEKYNILDKEVKEIYYENYDICLYIEENTGIPAKVMLAQIIIETGYLQSKPAQEKNNIFGIGDFDNIKPYSFQITIGFIKRNVHAKVDIENRIYRYDNIGDCIFSYVYALTSSTTQKEIYKELRSSLK